MKNMFIYGSLKKGFFNHSLIGENSLNKLVGNGLVRKFKLYLLWSYPAIKPASFEDKVFVELYSLTDEVFEQIDHMEQKVGYFPMEVEDDNGRKGIIYVYNGEVREENFISLGNWTKEHEKLNITGVEDGN